MKSMTCEKCEFFKTCNNASRFLKNHKFGRCTIRDRLLGISEDFYKKELNILKCEEKDLKTNIQILIDNCVELPQNNSIISKGDYFYLFMYDRNEVKTLPFIGIFI